LIFFGQKALFLGAHPDDIELGCGGLLAHLAGETDALCVTLSDNQENPDLKGIVDQHYRSMDVLGVPREKVILEKFETRNFPRDRQAILEFLYDLNRRHSPDVVFVHTQADIHQDHAVVTMEALRAFRGRTVLGYDVLRSSYGFFPNFLIEITAEDVECKIKALSEYKVYSDKYYFDPATIRATSIRHGALAEREFAEGFDILRVVGSFAGRTP
jgi:LmbE family N-acetylglucosaminyl deacetylase